MLVPFRNEEQNLQALIDCLAQQTYDHWELILIDDHSEDQSQSILNEALAGFPHPVLRLSLENDFGKKAAIEYGVAKSKGELIITTDADCLMGPNWLRSMIQPFAQQQIQMVLGAVKLVGNSLFQKMQSLEFSALMGVTKVMAELKAPNMANGANLAYRKSAFESVEAYKAQETPSGDDEFLLSAIQKRFKEGIKFNTASGAVVQTKALADWASFRAQRLRWASKWKVGKRRSTILSALGVLLIQSSFLALIVYWIADSEHSLVWSFTIAVKMLSELLFIYKVRHHFQQPTSIISFLLCFILYPFYALYFGLAANFEKFEWKGRTYRLPK